MTRRQRRLTLIGGALGTVALAVGLVLFALKDSIVFFNSPTDLVEKHIAPGQRMRVGGLVKEGSLSRGDNLAVHFALTDGSNEVTVAYRGQSVPGRPRSGRGGCSRYLRHLPSGYDFGETRREVYAKGSGRCFEEA